MVNLITSPFTGIRPLSDEAIGILRRMSKKMGSNELLQDAIGISTATFYRAMRGEGVDYTTHALIEQYILNVKKKGEACQQQGSM